MEVRDKTAAGLESGYSGGAVRNNLILTRARTEEALEEFDSLFSFDEGRNSYVIPQELTDMTKYLWATREIINFAQSKSNNINIRHLQDALLLGGSFAAVALLLELVFPLSERLRKQILRY